MSTSKRANQASEADTTTASAHFPGLDIEVVHRRSVGGESEQLSISLQAVPSLEAFGRYVEAANSFVFWTEAARLAWFPWLEAARAAMLPWSPALLLAKPDSQAVSRSSEKPRSSA